MDAPARVDPKRRDTFWWPPYAVAFATAVLSLPIVYLVTYIDQKNTPPPCFGLGWGCTLDPGSTVAFFAALIALPVFLAASVAVAVMGFFGLRTRRARLLVVLVVPVLLLLWVLLAG